jgi:hypothetical protein
MIPCNDCYLLDGWILFRTKVKPMLDVEDDSPMLFVICQQWFFKQSFSQCGCDGL